VPLSGGLPVVGRADLTGEDLRAAPWLRAVLMPALVFVVAVVVIAAVVASGAVQGHRTYLAPAGAPTTQPTVIIEP
jgi:hypothetical protein